ARFGIGLAVLSENEQQDYRAEPAADAVEEREAEDLDRATRQPHGQSLDGMNSEPCVMRASSQKRCSAIGSPFSGSRMVSTGIPSGSDATESSNSRARRAALMYLPKPSDFACVGSPSVIRMIWS